jgi:hypothetical protein
MILRRIGFSTLVVGTALAVLASLLLVLPAGAASVDPLFVEGNPKCSGEAGPNQPSLGMDGGVSIDVLDLVANFDDGSFSVDLVFDAEAGTLSFSDASEPVAAVIMKGGPNANVYLYNPAVTADDDLVTPTNPNNDKAYGISHVDFCFEEPEEPSPSPSPTTTPSPSPSPTVTTTPSPSPSPVVEGTVEASPTESPTVLGVVLEQPEAAGELPMTGLDGWTLLVGLALMAAGGLLLAAAPGPALGIARRR